MKLLSLTPCVNLYHRGPDFGAGPLPSIFYFALSGTDSLCLDPYNQFVESLLSYPVRIFSLTLPNHDTKDIPIHALRDWIESMNLGKDPLPPFLSLAGQAIDFAIRKNLILPNHIGVAGLSRGALIASLLAAQDSRIQTLLGFAPLTRLQDAEPLVESSIAQSYDLRRHAEALSTKKIRFYIGNRDERVHTRACFDSMEAIVQAAHLRKIRPIPIELIIKPSIGRHGHGTSKETFLEGATWIAAHV